MKNLFLTLIAVAIAGCGAEAPVESAMQAAPSVAMDEASYDRSAGLMEKDVTPVDPQAPGGETVQGRPRKRVVTGSINLQHDLPTTIQSRIEAQVEALGGYVAGTQSGPDWADIQVRIPADLLDDFLKAVEPMAEVVSKNMTTTDITQEYYDLQTRIDNQDILVRRYRSYLAEARTIDDLLNIEARLSQETTELEQMVGMRQSWDSQVAYSTLSITIRKAGVTHQEPWPSIGEGLGELGNTLVWFFYGLTLMVLYIITIVLPVVGLVWILYVVGFGKIGLVRKLFTLGANKKIEQEKK